MAITIYGIKNCDTMKKAFKWLDEQGIEYQFHDYKKHGISEQLATDWLKQLAPEELVNKRGTTWRKLDAATKENLNSSTAKSIIMEHNSAVKRPLLDVDGNLHLGFKPEQYDEIFSQ